MTSFIISKRIPTPLSLLLFFLPTSLLALSLLWFLLACNGFGRGLLCLPNTTTFPSPSLFITTLHTKAPSTFLALKVQQQEPTPFPPLNPNSHNTIKSINAAPKTLKRRRTKSRSRRLIKLLLPTNQSTLFSSKAIQFFNYDCVPRFFMTWISPLDFFGRRELFSIETLFKSHPNACLLIVSNTLDSTKGRNLLKPFSVRGLRVSMLSPDYSYLFKHTPAELWFDRLRRGEIEVGEIPIGQNLSNLLRLVLLYKFGGVYIDTDVVIMKSFLGLRNAIGAQTIDTAGNWSRLNNAVLVFDKGHPLLYSFIEEFSSTFDGSKWGHNGPYLVSRVVSRVTGMPGFEFTALPPPAFYPVGWNRIRDFFRGDVDSNWVSAKLRWMEKESFALHLWNRQSRRLKAEEGSIVARIMSECCLLRNSSWFDL